MLVRPFFCRSWPGPGARGAPGRPRRERSPRLRAGGQGLLAVLLLGLGWLLPPSTAAGETVALVAHRGYYSLHLSNASSATGIIGATGELYFEFADACDGWIVNQYVRLVLTVSQGEATSTGLLYSGWEAKDGSRFRYQLRHMFDGQISEEIAAEVELSEQGGVARFTEPTRVEIDLPAGTLFPTSYSINLLERMTAGASYYAGAVFDGSTVGGPYEVTTFIARPHEGPLPGAAVDDTARERYWPIRMAYFLLDGDEAEPVTEIGALMNAGGVSRTFDLDYGSYSVRAELQDYQALPEPIC